VVGVRAAAGVRLPALRRVPGGPPATVPDDVHDAQAAGHGVRVAELVRGQQPAQQVADLLGLRGHVGPRRPVPGPSLLVLAPAADLAATQDPPGVDAGIRRAHQVAEAHDARLLLGGAVRLALVGRVAVDRRAEARGRRGGGGGGGHERAGCRRGGEGQRGGAGGGPAREERHGGVTPENGCVPWCFGGPSRFLDPFGAAGAASASARRRRASPRRAGRTCARACR
jgi:hypothetical protein